MLEIVETCVLMKTTFYLILNLLLHPKYSSRGKHSNFKSNCSLVSVPFSYFFPICPFEQFPDQITGSCPVKEMEEKEEKLYTHSSCTLQRQNRTKEEKDVKCGSSETWLKVSEVSGSFNPSRFAKLTHSQLWDGAKEQNLPTKKRYEWCKERDRKGEG